MEIGVTNTQGMRDCGNGSEPCMPLTVHEARTHFGAWAIVSSPDPLDAWRPEVGSAIEALVGPREHLRLGPRHVAIGTNGRAISEQMREARERLDAIRAAPGNDALRGEVSSKWYDDNRFFSNQMLYGRFQEGEAEVNDVLFPAFVDYLDAYVDLVSSAPLDPAHAEAAGAGHADYDVFNAARDPAHGLFTSYFGEDWANDFVHDFLFESAPRTSGHE